MILNQGGDNLTNADVVDAFKVIQQWTKRKSSNQEMFKFQDPTTPPHKMFRDKRGIFRRVHWKLPGTGPSFCMWRGPILFQKYTTAILQKHRVVLICAYYVFDVKYVFPFHRPKTSRIKKCMLFKSAMHAQSYVSQIAHSNSYHKIKLEWTSSA